MSRDSATITCVCVCVKGRGEGVEGVCARVCMNAHVEGKEKERGKSREWGGGMKDTEIRERGVFEL